MFLLNEPQNPLTPTGFDAVWGVFAVVSALLFVVAFVVLIRKRNLFSLTAAILWFLGIVFVPVAGPLFLLLFTRAKEPNTQATAQPPA